LWNTKEHRSYGLYEQICTDVLSAVGDVWHKPIDNNARDAKGMLQEFEQNAMIYTVKSGREI